MPGRLSRDPLSNVLRRGLELRNTCVTHMVGLSATLCHAFFTSDQMVDGVGGSECKLQARTAPANTKKLKSAKYLNCKTKVQFFRSLVLSVLLPEPTLSQGRRLEALQMKCLRRLSGEPRVQILGRERISDVHLRRQLEIQAIESQIRRARLRYASSLMRVAQPSVAALLSVGRKAPADWARMLLGDLDSLRSVCPLIRNLGDPSIDWERWRALLVTPVGDRAMRLSQTCESN